MEQIGDIGSQAPIKGGNSSPSVMVEWSRPREAMSGVARLKGTSKAVCARKKQVARICASYTEIASPPTHGDTLLSLLAGYDIVQDLVKPHTEKQN